MFSFLRNYRATSHSTTGYAPASAIFRRPMNIQIPFHDTILKEEFDCEKFRERDNQGKEKMKGNAENKRSIKKSNFKIGDKVLVKQQQKDKFSKPFNSTPMVVTNVKKSMVTAKNDEKFITRNASHFKKIASPENITQQQENVERMQPNTQAANSRSKQKINKPRRLLETV